MNTFHVGQRVVIVHSERAREMIGAVVKLVGLSSYNPGYDAPYQFPAGHPLWVVDVPSKQPGYVRAYPPKWLVPYRPDHNEKVEWTDELRKLCQPKVRA